MGGQWLRSAAASISPFMEPGMLMSVHGIVLFALKHKERLVGATGSGCKHVLGRGRPKQDAKLWMPVEQTLSRRVCSYIFLYDQRTSTSV